MKDEEFQKAIIYPAIDDRLWVENLTDGQWDILLGRMAVGAFAATTNLSIFGTQLDAARVRQLSKALLQMPLLAKLELLSASLCDDAARQLCSGLLSLTELEELRLENNSIGAEGAAAIVQAAASLAKLATLNLSRNALGRGNFNPFAIALGKLYSLQILNLSNNLLGNDRAVELSAALRLMSALKVLRMESCQIGKEGMDAICTILPCMPELSKLEISFNEHGLKNIPLLCRAILYLPQLTNVGISDGIMSYNQHKGPKELALTMKLGKHPEYYTKEVEQISALAKQLAGGELLNNAQQIFAATYAVGIYLQLETALAADAAITMRDGQFKIHSTPPPGLVWQHLRQREIVAAPVRLAQQFTLPGHHYLRELDLAGVEIVDLTLLAQVLVANNELEWLSIKINNRNWQWFVDAVMPVLERMPNLVGFKFVNAGHANYLRSMESPNLIYSNHRTLRKLCEHNMQEVWRLLDEPSPRPEAVTKYRPAIRALCMNTFSELSDGQLEGKDRVLALQLLAMPSATPVPISIAQTAVSQNLAAI